MTTLLTTLLMLKVQANKDMKTCRPLFTPTDNPQDWYLGPNEPPWRRWREYRYRDDGKVECQLMPIHFIKRLEKMHNISLLGEIKS